MHTELRLRFGLHIGDKRFEAGDVVAILEPVEGLDPDRLERLLRVRGLTAVTVGGAPAPVDAPAAGNGLTCVKCGKPLTGRQTKYCGQRCSPNY